METTADFECKGTELVRYKGPGGAVVIPEGITEVRGRAFMDRTDITAVTIPAGVKGLGWNVFSGCTALEEISFPEGIKRLGEKTLAGCTNLKRVVLPESLTFIGGKCFSGCTSLESLTVPKKVEEISHDAFYGCIRLRDLRVERGNPNYTSQDVVIYDKRKKDLLFWPGASGRVEIPGSVVGLGRSAFGGCTGLECLHIPAEVKGIHGYCSYEWNGEPFQGCINLREFQAQSAHQNRWAEGGALYIKRQGKRVLVSWPSAQGEVSIPEGVEVVGAYALAGCTGLTVLRFPESVTQIAPGACQDCTGLREAFLPSGETDLNSTFPGCSSLTRVHLPQGLRSIGNGVFQDCASLEELVFPEGTERILFDSFEGCSSLKRVVLPGTVTYVGNVYRFQLLEKQIPRFRVESPLLKTTGKCPVELSCLVPFASGEELAYVTLYQATKAWKNEVDERLTDQPELAEEVVSAMTGLLSAEKRPKKASWERAAALVLARQEYVKDGTLQAFCDLAREKKAPVLAELEGDAGLRKRLSGGGEETAQPPENPVERVVWENWKVTPAVKTLQGLIRSGIHYKDSEERCSPEALIWLIAANSKVEILYGSIGFMFGEYDDAVLHFDEGAEQIAAGLDRAELMEVLSHGVFEEERHAPLFIPAYCRYAGEEEMQKLIKQAKEWHNWYRYGKPGRTCEESVHTHLYLSETKAAMRNCNLRLYAAVRGTDAQTLRDTVLADLGLDREGKTAYDLGNKTVQVSLKEDLTLSLYDPEAGKTLKSIPKKGADPEKYEAAKKAFALLKKDIKSAVKERTALLFQRFLDGEGQKGEDWKKVYFHNPLLNQMARLLVWSQDENTFIMTDRGTVDSAGQPYAVSGEPVRVAHPMEMTPEVRAAWQRYFTSHGLKQPFEQVWEPLVKFDTVRADRYQGRTLPANQLRSQDKHGIYFRYDNGTSELETSFADLDLECDFTEFQRHWMEPDARVVFGALKVEKPSRAANHVLVKLDRWLAAERVQADDATVVDVLDRFTLAQVTELLNLAIENHCANCTAALLEYKNRKFPDFDPMDVFTLE